MNKKVISVAELFLTAFIWGIAFVAQSVGMDYIGPFTFNCIRFLIGGIVLIPVILVFGRDKKEERTQEETKMYRKNTILGGIVCGFFLWSASTFQQFGIVNTSVGKAGFITALYIVLVPILGVFLHKKVTPLMWLSVIIAVIGFYMLCISGHVTINKGDLYVLVCAVLFSFH
ncbi:MAG: DMT family transporter, partial [Lachnospiraceae bacterium]